MGEVEHGGSRLQRRGRTAEGDVGPPVDALATDGKRPLADQEHANVALWMGHKLLQVSGGVCGQVLQKDIHLRFRAEASQPSSAGSEEGLGDNVTAQGSPVVANRIRLLGHCRGGDRQSCVDQSRRGEVLVDGDFQAAGRVDDPLAGGFQAGDRIHSEDHLFQVAAGHPANHQSVACGGRSRAETLPGGLDRGSQLRPADVVDTVTPRAGGASKVGEMPAVWIAHEAQLHRRPGHGVSPRWAQGRTTCGQDRLPTGQIAGSHPFVG